MRFMVENVSAGPNINRARRFLVECPEAGARLLNILKDAIVRHLVEQIIAGAQVSGAIFLCRPCFVEEVCRCCFGRYN